MSESILMQFPPEIWYMILKYVGYYDSLNARVASIQLAAYIATSYHGCWRVDCCKGASDSLYVEKEASMYSYRTSLTSFIDGLRLAPLSAQRVIFVFCKHRYLPVHRENCSTQKVVEMFGLLKARRITISIRLRDRDHLSSICNESLIQAMLFYSIKKLPNATVNFRMNLPSWIIDDSKDIGAYFMAIRDPSMSSAAVKTNLQLALSATTVPQLRRNVLWDFAQVHYISGDGDIRHVGSFYFPELRCLTCSANFDCTNPDKLLKKFPKCEWPTARYWNNPDMQPTVEYPGSKFYFDYVPEALARHCTKISAHAEVFEWIAQFLRSNMRLEYVKVFEFHLTGTTGKLFKHVPQTPSTLTPILSCCLGSVPNVETINFMFDPEIWNDMARPELLTKGQSLRTDFCQHCQQNVHVIEIGITAMRDCLRNPDHKTGGIRAFWDYIDSLKNND